MPDDKPTKAEKTGIAMTSRLQLIGAAGMVSAGLLAAEPAQAIVGSRCANRFRRPPPPRARTW